MAEAVGSFFQTFSKEIKKTSDKDNKTMEKTIQGRRRLYENRSI